MKFILGALLCLLLLPSTVFASYLLESKFTCPIGEHTFKQLSPVSGTSFGSMLDYQQSGPITSPWMLPECPQDGFVLYKDTFTEKEIETLRPFVLSPEYQSMREIDTSYWLIAKCMKKLGVPRADRADTLLCATWQAKSEQQYRDYALETLAALEELLAKGGLDKERIETVRLLIGELYRRVGDFDQAKKIFTVLAEEPDFKGDALYMKIITLQLELIEAEDTDSHRMPSVH